MDFPPGTQGAAAARAYKALPPERRHSETVVYTDDPKGVKGFSDLVGYSRVFASGQDRYTAADIGAATGLDLTKAPAGMGIDKIWDLNNDGAIDTPEMVVGVAQLDYAGDDRFNGEITETDRKTMALFLGNGSGNIPMVRELQGEYRKRLQTIADATQARQVYAKFQKQEQTATPHQP